MSVSATSAPAPGKPRRRRDTAVDIDRRSPVLGNPFVLHDHRDAATRAEVIERYRAKFEDDLQAGGPMAAATAALAERIRKGEHLVLMCWCWPKPCHGNLIIAEINRRLRFRSDDARASSEGAIVVDRGAEAR
jgi:hypothetical protein